MSTGAVKPCRAKQPHQLSWQKPSVRRGWSQPVPEPWEDQDWAATDGRRYHSRGNSRAAVLRFLFLKTTRTTPGMTLRRNLISALIIWG